MASEVKLPRLGQGMESGTVVKWLKAVGDTVEKGEPLYEIDTEKATQEVEAEASGVLLSILVEAGDVPVGETVGVIGAAGEEVAAPAAAAAPAPVAVAAAPAEPAKSTADIVAEARTAISTPAPAAANSANGGRIKASPLARRMARERGIELSSLSGTGPDGRVVAEDVERAELGGAAPAAPVAAPRPVVVSGEVEQIPHTSIRRTIARRLTEAWQIPAFQLTVSVDMAAANALVDRSRELNPDVRVTVTDLLAKVCGNALVRHREVNAQYSEEAVLRFPSANVGIAVAAPQGLVVPVLHSVERLSLAEVAQARTEIVGRSRDGKLTQADLEGGTFTISNLGMFGIEVFSAVLNPPQAAILAVGTTEDRAVVRDGQVVVRPTMTITLTVDHRAVDGAEAAGFLRTVKTFLEDPALAL